MEVRLNVSFDNVNEETAGAYARVIINAVRKWRPEAHDFVVSVATKSNGVTIISEK